MRKEEQAVETTQQKPGGYPMEYCPPRAGRKNKKRHNTKSKGDKSCCASMWKWIEGQRGARELNGADGSSFMRIAARKREKDFRCTTNKLESVFRSFFE
ncbi:hypothetical protein DM860_014902 [Cuscuta australis]|uniref:Uncharacterized protein n=1 Tax=Cuscuta australis TaxID=267555 RepID=A0A328E2C3_9ASTE|nr:hypothetical protein DM860_014902 [Cuscuta australis]